MISEVFKIICSVCSKMGWCVVSGGTIA